MTFYIHILSIFNRTERNLVMEYDLCEIMDEETIEGSWGSLTHFN